MEQRKIGSVTATVLVILGTLAFCKVWDFGWDTFYYKPQARAKEAFDAAQVRQICDGASAATSFNYRRKTIPYTGFEDVYPDITYTSAAPVSAGDTGASFFNWLISGPKSSAPRY